MNPLFSYLISTNGIVRVCFVALAVLAGAPRGLGAAAEPVFPAQEWTVATPAQQEMDGNRLVALDAKIGGRGVVVRNGYLVHSWGTLQRRGDWYSASNPLLSTLLFFAIEEGRLDGVRHLVADFYWDFDSKDRGISFWHLANMTSGYSRPEPAGTAFGFNQYGIQLLQMSLFDRVFNAPPVAVLLQRDRLGPLQFQDRPVFRERTNTLLASVRDFARIAWFWCQKGKWGERQLLPKHYFEEYCRPQVSDEIALTADVEANDYLHIGNYRNESDYFGDSGPGVYGFHWWFNAQKGQGREGLVWPDAPEDTMLSVGIRGNVAVIIPSLNLVLVSAFSDWGSFAPDDPDSHFNEFLGELVGAVQ